MGGKIRHSKLKKVEHFYDLEANGIKYTVKLSEDGKLYVFTDRSMKILPHGNTIVVIGQEILWGQYDRKTR
jgi:hypothetical protein